MGFFKCEKCCRIFDRKSTYEYHISRRKRECTKEDAINNLKTLKKMIANPAKCEDCGKLFATKSNMIRHKRKCCIKANPHDKESHSFECTECGKYFSRKDNLKRHTKSCGIKKSKHNDNLKELAKEVENMKNKLEMAINESKTLNKNKNIRRKSKNTRITNGDHSDHSDHNDNRNNSANSTNSTNSTNSNNSNVNNSNNIHNIHSIDNRQMNNSNNVTNNTTQNIQNNIALLPFSKENLAYITDSRYRECFKKGGMSIPKLIEYIHFNKDKPEHHNIYFPNFKNPQIEVYNGDRWNLQNLYSVLDDIYDDKEELLKRKYDELFDTLDDKIKARFNRFYNTSGQDNVRQVVLYELKQLLYNKRYFGKNSKRKRDKQNKLIENF